MTTEVLNENGFAASPTHSGFAAFGLPRALMNSLVHMKYTNPTPVQAQAIPAAMKGKDVLGSAQTGTGKTGAFIIPILSRLMTDPHASALIMSPTRELAAQILTVARQMLHQNNTIKTALLIGGESMGRQRAQLAGKPRLILGTPGRINDHLRGRPNLFATTNILVLDEADRMLDMGFTPQINEVLKHMTAPSRQTLLFSATFPREIISIAQTYMRDPIRVTIEPERTSAANITHETREVNEKTRYEDLMDELYNRQGSIIVFIKTKHGADRITKRLQKDGHSTDVIHGGLSQNKRDRAIAAFRNKKTRIMVATDVAARGLDVPHIEHVINYDLPQVAEDYVHRIGRTGRNGQDGRALSFLMPSERGKWKAIQRILNPEQKEERSGGRKFDRRQEHKQDRAPKRDFGHSDREFERGQQKPQEASKPFASKKPFKKKPFNKDNRFDNRFRDRDAAFKGRNFEGRNSEPNGNVRPIEHDADEINFNVEGASGEDRFNDRPFREHDRKPHGAFHKKKKFFGKGKGGFKGGHQGGQKRPFHGKGGKPHKVSA
jgi:superfamily II DNA/RNA helicase